MVKIGSHFKWNKTLEKRLLKVASRMAVGVGIPKDATYPNGTKVETVAFRMELGGESVPPRPFMRSTAIQKKSEWKDKAREGLADIIKGKAVRTALESVGEKVKEDVKTRIDELTDPPLKPSTIATKIKKGSPKPRKPLIDTGLLRSSLTVEVRCDD